MIIEKDIIERIFRIMPKISRCHNHGNDLYIVFDSILTNYFKSYKKNTLDFEPLKGMRWPHRSLGNISSYCFFTLQEILLYCFYWINKPIYNIAIDLGANIGIDSIILSQLGYEVHAYEPDPFLFEILEKNVQLNKSKNIHLHHKAISDKAGIVDFIRVKGNTTASHIRGSRDCYGDTETLTIETIPFGDILVQPDLMKINVEGHEKYIVPNIDYSIWARMDVFIEVHDDVNSNIIFDYFYNTAINVFAQKISWKKVENIQEMPMNNKEGYIFISQRKEMPWGAQL